MQSVSAWMMKYINHRRIEKNKNSQMEIGQRHYHREAQAGIFEKYYRAL